LPPCKNKKPHGMEIKDEGFTEGLFVS